MRSAAEVAAAIIAGEAPAFVVFYAAERPYGLIEATICRAGAPSADQAWMGVAGFC